MISKKSRENRFIRKKIDEYPLISTMCYLQFRRRKETNPLVVVMRVRGVVHRLDCHKPICAYSSQAILAKMMRSHKGGEKRFHACLCIILHWAFLLSSPKLTIYLFMAYIWQVYCWEGTRGRSVRHVTRFFNVILNCHVLHMKKRTYTLFWDMAWRHHTMWWTYPYVPILLAHPIMSRDGG